MSRGACRGQDTTLFFGPEGERQAEAAVREAEAVAFCQGCTVITACLDYALEERNDFGIWGGKTAAERKTERRNRQRQAVRDQKRAGDERDLEEAS